MSLYMILPEEWVKLDKTKYFDPVFIKKFEIGDIEGIEQKDGVNEDLKKIIKREGLGNLTLLVQFEISFNGKEYVLEAEIQSDNADFMRTDVQVITQTPVATEFVNDVFRKFNVSLEDAEKLKTVFFSEYPFSEYSPLYAKEAYQFLESVIEEIESLADEVVLEKLREYVKKYVLDYYSVDIDLTPMPQTFTLKAGV